MRLFSYYTSFILFLALSSYSFAQGNTGWESQTSGTTYDLKSLSFVNQNTGWVVGYDTYYYKGIILKTTNGGTNWTKIINGLPYRWVTRIAIHNDSANVCYVTLSGYKVDSTGAHIYRTSNYGASWQSISSNLPNAPVNDVVIDPSIQGTLYIGTDVGVMATSNYGASWYVLDTGIPSSVPCHDLTLHNPTRKLVVWTHGRSAYQTTLPPVGIISTNEIAEGFKLSQNYPNPFNPATKIEISIPKSSAVKLIVYDILGRIITTLVNEKLNAGSYKVDFDGSDLSSGVYFYKLEAGSFVQTRAMILLK